MQRSQMGRSSSRRTGGGGSGSGNVSQITSVDGSVTINPASGTGIVDLSVAGIGNLDTSETVASAAGAVWDGITVSGTATVTGNTNITNTAGFNSFLFDAPTVTAAGAVTITYSATVAIEGPPAAAGSATITNAYALWIQAGNARFDADVLVGTAAKATNADRVVSVYAADAGDGLAALELRGSRTINASFGRIYGYHQGNEACAIKFVRDGAADQAGISFDTTPSGGVLTTHLTIFGNGRSQFFGRTVTVGDGVSAIAGLTGATKNMDVDGGVVAGNTAAYGLRGRGTNNGDVFAYLAALHNTTEVGRVWFARGSADDAGYYKISVKETATGMTERFSISPAGPIGVAARSFVVAGLGASLNDPTQTPGLHNTYNFYAAGTGEIRSWRPGIAFDDLTIRGADLIFGASAGAGLERLRIQGATGQLQFAAASITANGAQTVTVGNLAPGGAGVTIQEWLTVINTGGNTRYIPMFA